MEKEVWEDIEGYEGRYMVSDLGRIKSLPNRRRNSELILKTGVNRDGYPYVNLHNGKGYRTKIVHRLVAEHHVPSIPGKKEVNHVDGNKNNNYANNLIWCTRAENIGHAIETGLNKTPKQFKGEKSVQAKITDKNAIEIRRLYSTGEYSQGELAKIFKISQTSVWRITTKQTWNHI